MRKKFELYCLGCDQLKPHYMSGRCESCFTTRQAERMNKPRPVRKCPGCGNYRLIWRLGLCRSCYQNPETLEKVRRV